MSKVIENLNFTIWKILFSIFDEEPRINWDKKRAVFQVSTRPDLDHQTKTENFWVSMTKPRLRLKTKAFDTETPLRLSLISVRDHRDQIKVTENETEHFWVPMPRLRPRSKPKMIESQWQDKDWKQKMFTLRLYWHSCSSLSLSFLWTTTNHWWSSLIYFRSKRWSFRLKAKTFEPELELLASIYH